MAGVLALLLLAGCAMAGGGEASSPSSAGQSTVDLEDAVPRVAAGRAADTGADWLYAAGNRIVDGAGNPVWITGVNWFGHNTGTNTFDGLWGVGLEETVAEIANRGFNLIRVPFSVELIRDWSQGHYPPAAVNAYANEGLADKSGLEIFDTFLACCEENGLKVMIDIHSAKSDGMGHMVPMWYEEEISEAHFLDALAWMAARYCDNDTLLAYDLKNEPHGQAGEELRAIWNDSDETENWRRAATEAAKRVLAENPDALVVVEGIEIYPRDTAANGDFASRNPDDYHHSWWGANLRGVREHPLELGEYQNKLVYSPHDYGPGVYQQPWFEPGFNHDSLYEDYWQDNWMYIHEEEIAPLLVGEWGGFMEGDNLDWLGCLRQLIVDNRLHHTYWCLNPNSGDTGGLLLDDFASWDEERYAFVKEALWQEDGAFIGLDGQVPLGENGRPRPT